MPNGISYALTPRNPTSCSAGSARFWTSGRIAAAAVAEAVARTRTLGTRFSVGADGFPIRIGDKKPSEVQFLGYRRAKKEDVELSATMLTV